MDPSIRVIFEVYQKISKSKLKFKTWLEKKHYNLCLERQNSSEIMKQVLNVEFDHIACRKELSEFQELLVIRG